MLLMNGVNNVWLTTYTAIFRLFTFLLCDLANGAIIISILGQLIGVIPPIG